MPPNTTITSTITPQMPRSANQRSAQLLRSPGGAAVGSRQAIHATTPISSSAVNSPGSTPAANSLPMFVSVTMP